MFLLSYILQSRTVAHRKTNALWCWSCQPVIVGKLVNVKNMNISLLWFNKTIKWLFIKEEHLLYLQLLYTDWGICTSCHITLSNLDMAILICIINSSGWRLSLGVVPQGVCISSECVKQLEVTGGISNEKCKCSIFANYMLIVKINVHIKV